MTQTNLSMKQRTDLWLLRGKGEEWESGASRCKLLYIEWKNNKDLLYTTGNVFNIL